jgi:lipoprotein-releasing system permease protein
MKRKVSFEWQIGRRYTHTKQRGGRRGFISFISLISMLGITLGVAALIVVLSVMNGFQKDVRDRMLSVLSHIEVFDAGLGQVNWSVVQKEVLQNKEVLATAPYVNNQVMLMRDDILRGVMVRGVSPTEEFKVSDIVKQIKQGNINDLKTGEFSIILGGELARALHVGVGDKITMLAAQDQMTPAGFLPRIKLFTVVGIFDSGHFEYDSTLALMHIEDAQKMFRSSANLGLRLKLADMHRAPQVALSLSKNLTETVYIRDWSTQNRNWFAAVQVEKRMMFIILTLIIAVAAFNLVSTLVMTVTDKQADIAILRTLGASPLSIMKIFIIQGALIGVVGTLMGVVFGSVIALNIDTIIPFIENLLGVHFLPKDIYLISSLPSDLHWSDVGFIGGVALILSLVATLYPSWCAAKVNPAQALRYE